MYDRVIKTLTFCSAIVVQSHALAEVPEDLLETPLALAFGAPPTIGDPMLSPEGARLLFLQQNPIGVSMLRSFDLENGAANYAAAGRID